MTFMVNQNNEDTEQTKKKHTKMATMTAHLL